MVNRLCSLEYSKEHSLLTIKQNELPVTTDTVLVKNQIAFSHISDFLEISKDTIKFLNPAYIHEIIPESSNRPHAITLLAEEALLYAAKEKDLYQYAQEKFNLREKPLPELYSINSKIIYRIKKGDYLGKISQRYGVKISDIKRWNNLKNDRIKENQRLIIFPKRIPKN